MSWLTGGDLVYLATLAVVFAGVIALVQGARLLFGSGTDVVADRLRRVTASPGSRLVSPAAGERSGGLLQSALAPIARLATPQSEEELNQLRARLAHAGFRGERAFVRFLATQVGGALALGLLAIGILAVYPQSLTLSALAIIALMALGFYTPGLYVRSRARDRRAEIGHALPNALDLLVTCVEAGLGLDAAMNRVAGELELGAPILSREMRQTAMEMSAGLAHGEAFRRMAERTGVDEVRSLAAIIVQTQMFGTSVARSLRVQAEAMRVRRTQIAEERAASVSVKMTVPLIFCIMPALFVALLGPGLVRIVRFLMPILGGH